MYDNIVVLLCIYLTGNTRVTIITQRFTVLFIYRHIVVVFAYSIDAIPDCPPQEKRF